MKAAAFPMVTVVAALVERAGSAAPGLGGGPGLFLARRAARLDHGGLWELPGGKVEDGETAADALRRELREELGLDAVIGAEFLRLETRLGDRDFRFVVFRVAFASMPSFMTAHDEVGWFDSADLPLAELAPLDLPILEAWLRGLPLCPGREEDQVSGAARDMRKQSLP